MRVFQFFSIVFLLYASSIMAGDAQTEESRIVELESKWSGMFSKRDLDGVMALMANKSVLIMPGVAPIEDIEGIRGATKTMMEGEEQVSWKSDFAHISSSGDMAYDYGAATTILADGSTLQGYYLVVWVKENGQWKVAADMFN
ncbi:MAG: ketosteroid isomerase-like protein [Paraglaciecola sp.]|jgi:ketosteroid isomerase-like protein